MPVSKNSYHSDNINFESDLMKIFSRIPTKILLEDVIWFFWCCTSQLYFFQHKNRVVCCSRYQLFITISSYKLDYKFVKGVNVCLGFKKEYKHLDHNKLYLAIKNDLFVAQTSNKVFYLHWYIANSFHVLMHGLYQ